MSTLLSLLVAPLLQQGPMYAGELHETASIPSDVELADFDGDGDLDALVPQSQDLSSPVWLYLATGADGGGLELVTETAAGALAADSCVADFDLDGHLDAAVGAAGQLHFFLGDGAGGLALASVKPLPATARSVDAADADLDGAPDFAVATGSAGTIAVYEGNGAGGVGGAVLLAADGTSEAVRFADLTGDGVLDLVATRIPPGFATDGVRIFRGDGAGAFHWERDVGTGEEATAVEPADLDGDGRLDLVVANRGSHKVAFLYSDGTGGFAPIAYTGTLFHVREVAVGDLEHDGRLDVVAEAQDGDIVFVYLGARGLEASTPAQLLLSNETGVSHGVGEIALGDLTGDGASDLAAGCAAGLSIYPGDGAGAVAGPLAWYLLISGPSAAADVNEDGRVDVVAAYPVRVLLGDGSGGLVESGMFDPEMSWIEGLEAPDVDGDGDADVVVAGDGAAPFAKGTVSVLTGDGSGAFASASSVPTGGAMPRDLAVADWNGDAVPDAIVVDSDELAILAGDGSGGSAPPSVVGGFAQLVALEVADFNSDGALDVAVSDWTSNEVVIVPGDGSGGAGVPIPLATSGGPVRLETADLDLDGTADLVASCAQEILIWTGTGSGLASTPDAIPTAGGWAVAADLDGDLVPEILEYTGAGTLRVFAGPPGAYAHATSFTTLASLDPMTVDLDADGRLELVTSQDFSGYLVVMRNLLAPPADVVPFGAGTAGCNGAHGLLAAETATVGDPSLALTCTGAPANGSGLLAVAAAADVAGSDPFGIGVTLHVDPFGPFDLAPLSSDAGGYGGALLAVPALPSLQGTAVHAQAFWIWQGACQPSALGLSSSNGLTLTIGP